jgi:endonuclease-3
MPRESQVARRERALRIVRTLFQAHPDAHCALHHKSAYQLLVATILSAQCTDKMVNRVTPQVFQRYPDAARLATADPRTLEGLLKPTGFFRQKTKTLRSMAQSVIEQHGGQIPKTMEELTRLSGVGRKTANVILGNAFGVPGMVVDTHVVRLSQRMGLTRETDPVKIERDLQRLVPEKDWTQFSHAMIFHGRRICSARSPQCELCPLSADCPFPRKKKGAGPAKRARTARARRSS